MDNQRRTFNNLTAVTKGELSMAITDIKIKKHVETFMSEDDFIKLLQIKMSAKMITPNIPLIKAALELAIVGHKNQLRDDGTPYIYHCINTARILVEEFGILDIDMIIAALLHDLIEDVDELYRQLTSPESLRALFGDNVANLVAGASKPRKTDPRFASDSERHKYFFDRIRYYKEKKEWGVWLIFLKLVDRLHNMRNIHHCRPEKRARKIKETIDIYLPMVEAIGHIDEKYANYLRHELLEAIEIANAVPADKLGPPLATDPAATTGSAAASTATGQTKNPAQH